MLNQFISKTHWQQVQAWSFEQWDTFLKSDHTTNNSIYLCSLKEQLEAFPIYQRIAGYSS